MPDSLLPYILYCVAMCGTPGPNNIMVMTSGVNFGYRRTLPHIFGVNIGFSLMLAVVALGLGAVFVAEPRLQLVLKVAGTAYMLWLAWRIATASAVGDASGGRNPMTFLEGAAFQWVNVKAWFMVVGAIAVYTPAGYAPWQSALYLGGVMLIAGAPPTHVWTLFGVGIRRFLQNPKALRAFNVGMALLLVLSLVPMLQ
jgi:threonine/homoserine/homoserine lactone efflux protein